MCRATFFVCACVVSLCAVVSGGYDVSDLLGVVELHEGDESRLVDDLVRSVLVHLDRLEELDARRQAGLVVGRRVSATLALEDAVAEP